MSDPQSIFGIVATGRNEGDRLKRCSRSIPTHVSVIFVDSASTDDSVAFARSKYATVVELDISKPFSAARARNEGFGALLSTKPHVAFVQFVDGDCELEPEWLGRATQFLETHPSVAAVCGRRRERFSDASLYNRMCDEEWNTRVGQADACGDVLYQREVMSILLWTLGVALAAMASAAIFGPAGLLAAPAIWLSQLLCLGLLDGFAKGGHMLLGKIAETAGISRFVAAKVRGSSQGAIFYK